MEGLVGRPLHRRVAEAAVEVSLDLVGYDVRISALADDLAPHSHPRVLRHAAAAFDVTFGDRRADDRRFLQREQEAAEVGVRRQSVLL